MFNHLVAGNVTEARAQWMATFARDRADRGGLGSGQGGGVGGSEGGRPLSLSSCQRVQVPKR